MKKRKKPNPIQIATQLTYRVQITPTKKERERRNFKKHKGCQYNTD